MPVLVTTRVEVRRDDERNPENLDDSRPNPCDHHSVGDVRPLGSDVEGEDSEVTGQRQSDNHDCEPKERRSLRVLLFELSNLGFLQALDVLFDFDGVLAVGRSRLKGRYVHGPPSAHTRTAPRRRRHRRLCGSVPVSGILLRGAAVRNAVVELVVLGRFEIRFRRFAFVAHVRAGTTSMSNRCNRTFIAGTDTPKNPAILIKVSPSASSSLTLSSGISKLPANSSA